jgi:hypothetical protein
MTSQSLWLVLWAMCLVLLGGGYATIAAAETKSATQCVSGQCPRVISRTITTKIYRSAKRPIVIYSRR